MKPTIDKQFEKLAQWVSRRKWPLFPLAIVIPLLFTGVNRYFSGTHFFADFGDYAEIVVEMIVLGGIGVYICNVIAERTKIIQTLQASEGRYRALFDSAGDSIYIMDIEGDRPGQIVSANPAAAAMHGYTVEEMLSLNISDLHTPESSRNSRSRVERLLRREAVKEETTHRRKDGTVFPIEINARLLELGDHKYILAVDRDITERKAAEAALRIREAQLSDAVSMAHLGHWEYDVIKDQFTFNDHFYKIFRTTAEQVGGYTLSSADYARRFVHPDDMSVVGNEIRKSIEATDSDLCRQLEHRIVYADGEIGHISVRIFVVKDDLGRTVRTYGVNQDITERKRAEEAVRESEKRYRSLFENMVEGYAYCNMIFEEGQPLDFVYLDVNEAFERLTGLKNVVGKRVTEVIPGLRESNPELFATYGRVAQTGKPEKLETHVDALGIWFSISVYSTQREHFIAVFDNVTERKQAEVDLQRAETRYRRLFEDAPIMYVITRNERGVPLISDCNESFIGSVGYKREEIVGRPFADFYSPESQQELLERGGYARALEGEFLMGERQLLTRDGRLIPTLLYTATEVDPSGNVIGTRAMFVDITERKEAEEALYLSEERLELAVQAAELGLWEWDLKIGKLAWYNRMHAEVLGYPLDEMPADLRAWKDLIHPEDWPAVSEAFNSHLQGRRPSIKVECRIRSKAGAWKWVMSQSKIVAYDKEGKPLRVAGTTLDINERKSAEQEQEGLRTQLLQAQKMEAIGTLAGGVAHDFNNLLTVVLGFSELLLIGKDERDPSYADLHKINQAARSGAELVKSILTFSRKSEISPRPLDLNGEIEQVKTLLTRTIPKMIDISLVLSENLATVNADPTQIEQVLMNLAVNAKDAMPDGGKLTIETANVTLDRDYSAMHLGAKPGDYVLLSVSDTGHGMDHQTLHHIFEPFYTTKETGRGTGLGLAMVYGIVQQNNGHITCESQVGIGTTFRIYLPAIPAEIKSNAAPAKAPISRGTETVLIVDDEEFIRDLGKRILERSGYVVLTAANGKDALDVYKQEGQKISLVIMDLIMPEMGGKECFEKLLKIDPQVKVLLASGYTSGGTIKDAIALGAGGFVRKPYDMKQMLKTVREILDCNTSQAIIK